MVGGGGIGLCDLIGLMARNSPKCRAKSSMGFAILITLRAN
jgi:hypothetical protein